jgi:hypothetical protein
VSVEAEHFAVTSPIRHCQPPRVDRKQQSAIGRKEGLKCTLSVYSYCFLSQAVGKHRLSIANGTD